MGATNAAWLIFALLVVTVGCTPRPVIRVTELHCDKYAPSGKCGGQYRRGSELKFILNSDSRAVAMSVQENAGDWFVTGLLLKDCAIVDADNWECRSGDERIGMQNGSYRRNSSGAIGYQIDGLTGWRYWADQLGYGQPMRPLYETAPKS